MTTLKALGWDLTDYTSSDVEPHDPPEIKMYFEASGRVTARDEKGSITSDTIVPVEP